MRRSGTSKPTVWRWQARYLEAGVDGLLRDKSRPPGTPPLDPAIKALVLTKTMRETPADATHWSVRSMARAVGISHTSVQNIWREHGLKPHLVDTFKVSNDPAFAEKVEDVVGLYLDPPDKALVLSVDEKSQIQALDRTQPGLPIKKGRAGTMTHDYKRNGTTTLFAALNVLDGKVIGQCMKRHRHQEFIRFLNRIDRQTLPYLDIHLTPTSASWLNMIERFFAEITRKRIRRGAFKSLAELEQAIYDYLATHNQNPVPFVWTATAKAILKKTARAKQTLETVKAGTKC
jgi:transposase